MATAVKKRNIGFDIIRIIAILMVLYNHRESYTYFSQVPYMGIKYVFTIFASALCKCGPALFFMISGALILNKNEPFKIIFTHRILRILIVMVALTILVKGLNPDADSTFNIYTTGLNWYLYAYLGFLVMLPFIRILVQHMGYKEMVLFFIISVIAYSVNGILIPFANLNENFTGAMTLFNASWASSCWHLTFPILGYVLIKFSNKETDINKKKRFFICLLIGAILSLVICMFLMNYDMRVNGGNNLEQIRQHSNMLPCCFIVYALYDSLKEREISNTFVYALLGEFSAATFGIFLIETHTLYSGRIFDFAVTFQPYIGRYMCSIISIILELLIYFIITFSLRRIPYVNKVL